MEENLREVWKLGTQFCTTSSTAMRLSFPISVCCAPTTCQALCSASVLVTSPYFSLIFLRVWAYLYFCMCVCNHAYFVKHEQLDRHSGPSSQCRRQAALLSVTTVPAVFERQFFLTHVTASPENHTGTFFPSILTTAYNPSLQRKALKTALKGDIISSPFLSQKEPLIMGGGKIAVRLKEYQ